MHKRLRLNDRDLVRFEFRKELGPTSERPELKYEIKISKPVEAGKDLIHANVQALLRTGTKKTGKTGEPFLSLEMGMTFNASGLKAEEKKDLEGLKPVIEIYASNLCAEIISGVLMNTVYRMPNFPR